jgi:2,3-dihydroxybenzoate-AMP ligase
MQIKPALLIADRAHALFATDVFWQDFTAEHASVRVSLFLNDSGDKSLAAAIECPADTFIATPTPADEVAFFQLSGGSTGTPKLIPTMTITTAFAAAMKSAGLRQIPVTSTRCPPPTTMR